MEFNFRSIVFLEHRNILPVFFIKTKVGQRVHHLVCMSICIIVSGVYTHFILHTPISQRVCISLLGKLIPTYLLPTSSILETKMHSVSEAYPRNPLFFFILHAHIPRDYGCGFSGYDFFTYIYKLK